MTDIDPGGVTFVRASYPSNPNFFATARDRLRVQAGDSQAFARFWIDVPERREHTTSTLFVRSEEAFVGNLIARSVDPVTGAYRHMTWDSRPAVVAGSADRTATISGAVDRALTFDVTDDVAAALAAESGRVAFRLSATSSTGQWLRTETLQLSLVTRPRSLEPTDLAPAGLVGVAKPVFTWTAPSGITKVQLQVAGDTTFAAPVYDSGELLATTPRVDTKTGPAWAGVSGTMYARVRHFTSAGWSTWAQTTITYSAPTVFTVTNPPGTTADPTPPAVWTPAADAFEIITFRDGKRIGSTGLIQGPATSYTPKQRARRAGQELRRVHRFYDGVARVQPPYAQVVTETVYDPTATVAGLTGINATQLGALPAAHISWTRGEAPDQVGIYHDDLLVAEPYGPDAAWVDWMVAPNTDVTYGARAVVNGEHSDAMRTTHLRTAVEGVWLVDPYSVDESGDPATVRGVCLSGLGVEVAYGDVTVVHTPIDGAQLLRRTLTLRGPEGSITGRITDWPGRTPEEQKADVEFLRERPERELRLIMGDLNIPVVCSALQAVFDPEASFTDNIRWRVSFDFSHVSED